MRKKTLMAMVAAFIAANAAILATAEEAEARRVYLDCFGFVGGVGCTVAIWDDCPPGGPGDCDLF